MPKWIFQKTSGDQQGDRFSTRWESTSIKTRTLSKENTGMIYELFVGTLALRRFKLMPIANYEFYFLVWEGTRAIQDDKYLKWQ